MIVEKILKQLTPQRIQKEIEAIQKVKLPPELQKWVKEYNKVGDRDEFFWLWLFKANQAIVFPTVPKKYQSSLTNTKVLFNMFLALFDDVADRIQNKKFLNELSKIPFEKDRIKSNQLTYTEKKYLKFTLNLWNDIERIIKKYPRYKEFRELLEYDIIQLMNAMRYACLVNRNPYLINETEHWNYLSHNMQAIIDLTFDLMCSSRFRIEELGLFRGIAWQAQRMARIGNSITTWEKEIKDNDFTSGVFAHAIEDRIIGPQELRENNKSKLVKKLKESNIEKYFLTEWQKSYNKIKKNSKNIKGVKIKNFLKGLEKLLFFHLISRGYK